MKFGYWNLRGLGQFLRYTLEYAEADYEEVRYMTSESSKWFGEDKYALGFKYPNLPYLIDGDKKLTQSRTIATYIAKKYKLAGSEGEEEVQVSMAYDATLDLRKAVLNLVTREDLEEQRKKLERTKVGTYLKMFESALGASQWLAGTNTPSFADFAMYDILEQCYLMNPKVKENFPKLKAFFDRVNSLAQIVKYKMRKDEKNAFIDVPFYGPFTEFGKKRE